MPSKHLKKIKNQFGKVKPVGKKLMKKSKKAVKPIRKAMMPVRKAVALPANRLPRLPKQVRRLVIH